MINKKKKFFGLFVNYIYLIFFPTLNSLSFLLLKINSYLNLLLMKIDWMKYPPTEWMDHDQDTLYQFNQNGSFFHFERAIIPRLYASNFLFKEKEFDELKLEKKINILDFCSGDSYISQRFFFDVSNTNVSVDLDKEAIKRGKKRLSKFNFMNKRHYFFEFDIEKSSLKNFLETKNINLKFDIILFNAAIEHFKEEQLDFIFKSVKEVMSDKSFISTYTIVEDENENKYLPDHHEMFFESKEQLEKILSKYFKYTKTHKSLFNNRHNIYCIGSDSEIKI